MSETTDAIEKGVAAWMNANHASIQDQIFKASKSCLDAAVEMVAAAIMVKVGRFFDDNKDDLTTSIAAAIALSWQSRQHPIPGVK
jgi:hypothetical protein